MGAQTVVTATPEFSDRYEKLYTMLLDAIPSSVLLVDRDMRVLSANRNFLEKCQLTLANTIGQPFAQVFPSVILEHIDILKRIRQVFEKREPTRSARMTYRAPGVPIRIYYYTILPFVWDGITEGAMILMDDITEQVRLSEEVRRVERHLASIVESASDIVLSTDVEGRILTWNRAAERLSGFLSGQVRERFFFEFCAKESRRDVRSVLQQIGSGKHSQMEEHNLITSEGNAVPISWVFSPMRDHLNQAVGVVAVGRDLTERRKFEMQLLQSQKLAALGVMAGGIAHEIRNPLAICYSAAQFLMEEDTKPEFRKECAEKIYKGIQRAAKIIENLLKFAHPGMKTSRAEVSIVTLIRETLTLVAYHAKTHKIAIRSELPQEDILIDGVTDLLQQVFMNLFLNAMQAMVNGGVLTVSLSQDAKSVMIRIADTGRGINRGDLDKVFDPFYTTSKVGQGTGLGLSLCYAIVRQHDGVIEVESREGKGAVFTVRLPRK